MNISEFLRPENVIVDLPAATKAGALQALAGKAAAAIDLPASPILSALLAREKLGSTGLGDGIAIPHTRIAGLTKPVGVVARLEKPIDFEAIDGVPVDIVFLLLMPGESGRDHLNALASVARTLRTREVTERIRLASSAAEIYAALVSDGAK
jgi:PTS system nitrogen regulatory IIA component